MKMLRVVEVALNGDAQNVDPAVRRTLYALANEHDDRDAEIEKAIEELGERFAEEVKGVKRLLLGLTGTVVSGIMVAVANILLSL